MPRNNLWKSPFRFRRCLLWLCVSMFVTTVNAQKELVVAGTSFKIGMTKEEIDLPALRAKYAIESHLSENGNSGSLVILLKEPSPHVTLGVLEFKDGKIVEITRDWGTFSGAETVAFVRDLYDALGELSGPIETRVLKPTDQEGTIYFTTLFCESRGDHKVKLTFAQVAGAHKLDAVISLSEILSKER